MQAKLNFVFSLKKIKKISVFKNNKKTFWAFLCVSFLMLFNQCADTDFDASIEKLPAPYLTYQTQNVSFTALEGLKEKFISFKKIFNGVQGKKEGYEITNIIITAKKPTDMKAVENLEEGIPIDFIDRIGKIIFTIKLIHPKTKDVFLKRCQINVNKATAENLTFEKITKSYVKNGIFSPQNINGSIKGEKTGYTLKKIEKLNPTGLARVGGNKPKFGLYFIKSGRFTADLILEHEYKADATITAEFEIEKKDNEILWFDKMTKNYGVSTHFLTAEILANIKGAKQDYTLKEIKDIYPTDIVTVEGSAPNLKLKINKGGTFMANIVLEHPNKKDATIKDAQFEINKTTAENLNFTKFSTNYMSGLYFDSSQILSNVTGIKVGYTIKSISITNGTVVAGFIGVKPNLSIQVLQPGNFTVNLVLEHPAKADVIVNNAQFDVSTI